MASSLEELLAKEGFKASKRGTGSRSSFHYGASSEPLHSLEERLCVSSERTKTQGAKSKTASRYQIISNKNDAHTVENRRSRDNVYIGDKMNERLKIDETEKKKFNFTNSGKEIDHNSSEYMPMPMPRFDNEGIDDGGGVEDVYSDQVSNYVKRGKEKPFNELVDKDKRGGKLVKDSNMLRHLSGNRKNVKHQEDSYTRCSSSNSKSFEVAVSSLALDEVAVQALVSILNVFYLFYFY